jgi:DNA processing protein
MTVIKPVFDIGDELYAAVAWSHMVAPGGVEAVKLANKVIADHEGSHSAALRAVVEADEDDSLVYPDWLTRLKDFDPAEVLRKTAELGGHVLLPSDQRWPEGLRDLGDIAPLVLYVLGEPDLRQLTRRAVSVVGSRAATSYGEHVAAQLVSDLVEREFTIVSGGAYGIDTASHRAALAADGKTIAVIATGLDNLYPPGNQTLLRKIAKSGGAIVSEQSLGAVPTRQCSLDRTRLIAALGQTTVVVEAATRSGALTTAREATALRRPVGAVPGPITSAASVGCHNLIRQGVATLVTDSTEVAAMTEKTALVAGWAACLRRGLTIPQPWAWAIMEGGCRVVNLDEDVVGDYRGPVLIHAASKPDDTQIGPFTQDLEPWASAFRYTAWKPSLGELAADAGKIIGAANIVDVHSPDICEVAAVSSWAQPDKWHVVLDDPRPFPDPISWPDTPGLWEAAPAPISLRCGEV